MLLGAICVGVRREFRQKEPMARGDSIWQLTYTASFHVRKPDAKGARLLSPGHAVRSRRRVQDRRAGAERQGAEIGQRRSPRHDRRAAEDGRLPHDRPDRPAREPAAGMAEESARGQSEPQGSGTTAGQRTGHRGHRPGDPGDPAAASRQGRQQDGPGRALYLYCFGDIRPGGESVPQEAAAALAKGVASPLGCAGPWSRSAGPPRFPPAW